MLEFPLKNSLSIKSLSSDLPASFRLAENTPEINYLTDNKVRPVLLTAVEDNNGDSQTNVLSAVKDALGNNRLCVDISGLAQANTKQTYVNASLYNQVSGVTLYTVTIGKTLYILGTVYMMSGATDQVALSINGVLQLQAFLPTNTSFSYGGNGVLLVVPSGSVIKYFRNAGVGGVTIWGYEQ
jgi:hypothetical protein